MEYTKAVVSAAEKSDSPVILMLGQPILKFAGLDTLANIALFAAKRATVPAAVLLDHGSDPNYIERAIELGMSIMVDGSHYSFDENVRFTRKYVKIAHARNLSVEGELGALAGSEDGEAERQSQMTDPTLAAQFVKQTGVDVLAVSIGNSHGLYKGKPKIDIDRLISIKKKVDVPIVMHGGSDLPDEISKELINNGMSKFNIGTDLKIAFSSAMREALSTDPIRFQPFDSLQYAMDKTEEKAMEKIVAFNSGNKASLYK